MDDLGAFIVRPVSFAHVPHLHGAVRAGCVQMGLPVDGIRVAYSAHAPKPTSGIPFVVVHLHVGTEDDVYDPFKFTIESWGGPEDASLASYVCEAFDAAVLGSAGEFPSENECGGWTVAREARTNFHSVVQCGAYGDEPPTEAESAEPLEDLAGDLRVSLPALVALLRDRTTPWISLSASPSEEALAALRALLPAT